MPTYYARKTGNINATDVWATTPSGTAAAVTFAAGDVLMANSFTITVNVSTDLGSGGQVRNDNTGGATAGGGFTLSNGVTLTASIFSGTTATSCVAWSSATPNTASIVAVSINSGSGSNAVFVNGSGTFNITATTITGGGSAINSRGIEISSVATSVNITASTIKGGTSNASTGLTNQGAANVVVTANAVGGDNVAGNATTAFGINNAGTGVLVLTGTATGGAIAAGVNNASTGTIRLTRAIGNGYGPGNTANLSSTVGASNTGLGVIEIEQLEYGTFGQSPTSGTGIRLKKVGTNAAVFNYADTAGSKTLIDATANAAMPAASHVRIGVSYASGALVGTCAVPAAGSVSLGVPVDNTTGTAILTQSDVQSALTSQGLTTARAGNLDNLDTTISSRLSPSGTLARVTLTDTVTTLTNAPTVPSASAIASQVRTELGTELGRLDASVSSRLASASYTAPSTPPTAAEITTAVWAAADKTGYSLTSAERSAIAAAVEGSLLNENDGQAVLNAIVGAIGNQNLSEVSLVAAVRADLERTGGKLDSIPTTAAPTAAQNATAVWSAATRSVTGGTVDTLTNAPASVTPSDIWSHSSRTLTSASGPTAAEIRQEIDTNSTKLDAAISSRLAASAYTAPTAAPTAAQNASAVRSELSVELARLDAPVSGATAPSAATVASAVRTELTTELAKVAALNTERLANVATTAIVGNLIAQSNS